MADDKSRANGIVDPAAGEAPKPPATFRNGALALLLAIYVLNFLDRQVLNILAEPIKKELQLADWQLGLMSGLAFALLYSLLGVPIARFAERGDRPRILAGAITVWSISTALCGLGQSFIQLLFIRVLVGVGEAGGTPPSHSLISEYFPREKRASALAIYSLGVPIGALLGLALGGLLADAYGWRMTFVIVAAPGVLLALGALAFLREPRRKAQRSSAADTATFGDAIKFLARNRTFWFLILGASTICMVSYGMSAFLPPFLMRNHGEEIARLSSAMGLQPGGFIGLGLGLMTGIGGGIGTFFGGALADRLGRRDPKYYVRIPAIAALCAMPCYALALLIGPVLPALLLIGFGYCFIYAWLGPIHATAQGIVPPNYRATIAAINLLGVNLIGLGLGPLLIGMLSDVFNTNLNLGSANGLRYAMISVTAIGLIPAYLWWSAQRSIARDTIN